MTPECKMARTVSTEALMLARPLPDPVAQHLAECAACNAEADGVRRTIATLDAARRPRSRTAAPGLPSAQRLVPIVSRPQSPPPQRARGKILAAVAASLLAASLLLPTALTHNQASQAAVSIERAGKMAPQPWGTEVPLSLSGLQPGRTYRLMAADAHGVRMSGGSVMVSTPQPVRTRMSTAMRRDAITTVLVEDQDGRLVATLQV